MPPVRKVLLDAFGTIFSPRTPVFAQYTEVARSLGLDVEEVRIKAGFKTAYKQWAASHPLYGKLTTPPLDATLWWAHVIHDTFLHAGVPPSVLVPPLLPTLTKTLTERFWSAEGYALHPDVLPFLDALPTTLGVRAGAGVVSGSDPEIVRVLRDLDVLSDGAGDVHGARVKEGEVWTTWEHGCEKRNVRFWEGVLERLNQRVREGERKFEAGEVLVVGDELFADYETPRKVGFRSLLLRRHSLQGEHARASYGDETGTESDLDVVADLSEVAEWIARENS